MIAFLEGIVAAKSAQSLVLDVGGIGYEVLCPTSLAASAGAIGSGTRVFTYLHVRENEIALYGFESPEQRALFLKMIGISGIGPKVALAALSTYTVTTLLRAIVMQEFATIQEIPGIGKKTAQRLVIELKESCTLPDSDPIAPESDPDSALDQDSMRAWHDAHDALAAMGFSSVEIETALANAPANLDGGALVTHALKTMGGAL